MSDSELLIYQRVPLADAVYNAKLATGLHLGYRTDSQSDFVPLNHNFGVLYPKATIDEAGIITAKSMREPYVFIMRDGTYGILAIRTEADGATDHSSKGCVLYFQTRDFVHFHEHALLRLDNQLISVVSATYRSATDDYQIQWQRSTGEYFQILRLELEADNDSNPEPIVTTNFVSVPQVTCGLDPIKPRQIVTLKAEQLDYLVAKLMPPKNVAIAVPEQLPVSQLNELKQTTTTAYYSDQTTALKQVQWYVDDKQIDEKAAIEIYGQVLQPQFPFPIAWDRADPCIGYWQGWYYFIATHDDDGDKSLYIRQGRTIFDLVTAPEIKILDVDQYDHIKDLLWAPEFHVLNDRLYLFLAASPQGFEQERAHVMALKQGGNPLIRADWQAPVPVIKADGSPLFTKGITLDMTVFQVLKKCYVVWSQRQLDPVDQGAWLYIAELDTNQPNKLKSKPHLLAQPLYNWENNHTFVVEGAHALIKDGVVNLFYSAAATDSTYVVGLLKTEINANLLDASSWEKSNYPLMSSLTKIGEDGPGHNAFITDEQGTIWNTYHARLNISGPRSSAIRRVHFDIDGQPRLDLLPDFDLDPNLAIVKTTLITTI